MMERDNSKKFKDAEESLRKIQKEIEPFTKPMKMEIPKSKGKWKTSSGNVTPDFTHDNTPLSMNQHLL